MPLVSTLTARGPSNEDSFEDDEDWGGIKKSEDREELITERDE